MKTNKVLSKGSVTLLTLIALSGISLSLLSYHYSTFTSNEIIAIATQDIKSNTENQAHDISRILVNKIEIISTNLHVLANAASVKNAEHERSKILFDTAENVVGPPADFFALLDQDGRLIWSGNLNQTQIDTYIGIDLSSRPYFTQPRDTGQPYYSAIIESVDDVARIFLSVPVVGDDGNFKGITYSGIRLDTMTQLLENEIPEGLEGRVSILDKDGIILHTGDQSFVGKNVFSDDVQSRLFPGIIPAEERDLFNNVMGNSLQGEPGSVDVTIQGIRSTIAFEPVQIDGQHFLTTFVVAPHALASNVGALAAQQNNLSITLIGLTVAVAVGVASLVLLWNKKLTEIVDARTAELRNANEQLKASDNMQREFINIAAHELRTPVQPLLGIADELEEQMKEGQQEEVKISRQEAEILVRNANRLMSITSNILDVSRIESNSLKLNKERIDLHEKIEHVIADTNLFTSHGSKVKIVFEPAAPKPLMVEADRTRLFEALSNLIRNAVKFTQEGVITVRLEQSNKEDGYAQITVKDTGSGIDPDIFPRLFTKFATKSASGTGLGLFITKSIIEAHGGRIWAENKNDGEGASFVFILPMTDSQKQKEVIYDEVYEYRERQSSK